jgi:hypothetical protein
MIKRRAAKRGRLFCGGDSVLQAVEQNYMGERLRLISSESHRFASDLALKGIDTFRFPLKPG